jgi:hypothetical protein
MYFSQYHTETLQHSYPFNSLHLSKASNRETLDASLRWSYSFLAANLLQQQLIFEGFTSELGAIESAIIPSKAFLIYNAAAHVYIMLSDWNEKYE